MDDLVWSVSDFVAVFNQTVEFAYPYVVVQGELANFRVSKGKWVYFDLKDEMASVKFFGNVYQLPGPLEDGLMIQVTGQPRLHPLYGFSINVQNIQPVGEGSLKRAAALLEAKLRKEGLFDKSRKRQLPYPPSRIGLITSHESAAYHDFIKILNARWGGVEILHADVQVQGEIAPEQIISALEYFNTHEDPADVLVITRGGGSAEDLAAFSTEQVTRAVAASRIPTLVAIGHEVDISLAEMAADQRASTPSNAAEMLVPDRRHELKALHEHAKTLKQSLDAYVKNGHQTLSADKKLLKDIITRQITDLQKALQTDKKVIELLNPTNILKRGYSLVYRDDQLIRSAKNLKTSDKIDVHLADGSIKAQIE